MNDFPDTIKLYKITLNGDARKIRSQEISGPEQFPAMMCRLGLTVSMEMSEAAISGAVGVTHYQYPLGLVQPDGHPNLFENEVLLKIVARGGKRFRPACDDDHVGALDVLFLQELSHSRADALIETAKHRRIGNIGVGWGIEMEDLPHLAIVSGITPASGIRTF